MNAERDTRSLILEHALPLFAKNGFDGVSIREIAKVAGVNSAAINYHFQNKENLYQEIVQTSYSTIQSHVRNLTEKKVWTVQEFIPALWKIFLEEGPTIANTFKVFTSDTDTFNHICQSDQFEGPPGSQAIIEIIKRQYPKIAGQKLRSVMHLIYSQLTHNVVILNTIESQVPQKLLDHPRVLKRQDIQRSIQFLTEILTEHLNQSK